MEMQNISCLFLLTKIKKKDTTNLNMSKADVSHMHIHRERIQNIGQTNFQFCKVNSNHEDLTELPWSSNCFVTHARSTESSPNLSQVTVFCLLCLSVRISLFFLWCFCYSFPAGIFYFICIYSKDNRVTKPNLLRFIFVI